jgi:thiol-disulfide isomerase/thioredoxin
MKKKNLVVFAMAIILILLVTACQPQPSGNTPTDQVGSVDESPTIEDVATDKPVVVEPSQTNEPEDSDLVPSTEEIIDTQEPTKDTPAWFDFPMVDVQTGQTFTINDYHGKVVLVETLAMWCSSCLKQQIEVKELHERLPGEDRFVSIGLDIDINEKAQDLKNYTENNQFDWLYAIAPVEVAREISELYGAQFLNPPSTPILVIDMSGEVHLMNFGIKSADELFEFVTPLLSQ